MKLKMWTWKLLTGQSTGSGTLATINACGSLVIKENVQCHSKVVCICNVIGEDHIYGVYE